MSVARRWKKRSMARARIPLIHSSGSPYPYVLAVDAHGRLPSRSEMRSLVSLARYITQSVPTDELAVMRAREYDLVMTSLWRTVIFHKFGHRDWGVKRQGEENFWPFTFHGSREMVPAHSLPMVLDRLAEFDLENGPCWNDWKRAHRKDFR